MKSKTYPLFFKFEEKHGEYYYQVKNVEEFDRLFLKILEERKYMHEWKKDYKPYNFNIPKFTKEDIDNVPENLSHLKPQMIKEYDAYQKELKQIDKYKKEWELIEKTINEKDEKLAYRLCLDFNDEEYEGFEEITFEEI